MLRDNSREETVGQRWIHPLSLLPESVKDMSICHCTEARTLETESEIVESKIVQKTQRYSRCDRQRIFWTAETPTCDSRETFNVNDVRTDGCFYVAISKNEAK